MRDETEPRPTGHPVTPSGLAPPIRIGSPEEFARLRTVLVREGFTLHGVCERLGIDAIYQYRARADGRTKGVELVDARNLLIRMLMDGDVIAGDDVARLLAPADIEALATLGLLRDTGDGSHLQATVALYPSGPVYVASDGLAESERADAAMAADVVYPAITSSTQRFLAMLPATPCEAFLELCSGTGVAALSAARVARHAWAADITGRAAYFARFNAALNASDNVTVVQGDLYGAVPGLTFDRIAAHPPYLPSAEREYFFRDGGADGEQVTRRIIEGLPAHLRPGGRLYCSCLVTDRRRASIEERVRAMLGDREGEFDVLVSASYAVSPLDYCTRLVASGRRSFAEMEEQHDVFRELDVEQVVLCTLVVQRRRTERSVFTVRRHAGAGTGGRELEWLLRWEEAATDPEMPRIILRSRPAVSPHTELRLSHRLRNEQWEPSACAVATEVPFPIEASCPPWVAAFLARCDGGQTVREQFDYLKEAGAVAPDAREEEFAEMVSQFVAGGILEIDTFRLPGSAKPDRAIDIATDTATDTATAPRPGAAERAD